MGFECYRDVCFLGKMKLIGTAAMQYDFHHATCQSCNRKVGLNFSEWVASGVTAATRRTLLRLLLRLLYYGMLVVATRLL